MIASPMKTLAKGIHARAQKLTKQLGLDVRLHTGEDQGAPLLEGDIVITTIDQLISNYAHIPLSMSNGRANIGAGAVISSYIVFDEFHLLDPKRAFQTVLLMIEQLQGITPFLLMTATLSSEMVTQLAQQCKAEVIEPTPEELSKMPSQQKTRYVQRVDGLLSAQAVVKAHQRRSLVILNTVARAQAMAGALEELKQWKPTLSPLTLEDEVKKVLSERLKHTRIELIHSQFMPSDRSAKEIQLEGWMGENSSENIILVATQAIEVGINISSENLHTELCPANSLLQRAGRCARFKGETGTVFVYDLPLDAYGKKRIMPYKELEVELHSTWAALNTSKTLMGFAEEAQLINVVHTARDLDYLANARASRVNHLETLNKAGLGDRGLASALIREVISQSVILHPSPDELTSWREVSKYEMVSLYPGKLDGALVAQSDTWGETEDWVIMTPSETPTDAGTRLNWQRCNDPKALWLAPLVALNPKKVFYSPQLGLLPDVFKPAEGQIPRLKKAVDPGERQDWWYTFETYREHIENVMAALGREAREVLAACPKVDAKFNLPEGTLEQAIRVAIAAHDIGKLSTGWQNWTRDWQQQQLEMYPDLLWDGIEGQRKVKPQSKGVFCAHTDYHPDLDKARSKDQPKQRPGHAGESACVLEKTYYDCLLDRISNDELGAQVFCGIYGAIVRHHGAYSTGETTAWKLDAGSCAEAAQVFADLANDALDMAVLGQLEKSGVPAAQPNDLMPQPTVPLAWLTYSLVSRALRQADSKSFIRHEVHKEANEN
jgi:CRISPR-associated endonuclease/helicase Cas3